MGIIKKSKRGIFFTFISILIMAALVIIATPPATENIKSDSQVIEIRVNKINDFVFDLEASYMETVLKVSSHRAILALTSYMKTQNVFLKNLTVFSEVAAYGTINSIKIDSIIGQKIMENNTIKERMEGMINISMDMFNINFNFTINQVNITQTSPWLLDLQLNINFIVNSETADWDVKDFIVNAELDINNFEDPYYAVNTRGRYINIINETNITFNQWNLENFREHLRKGAYTHFKDSKAPSFLMRLTNTSTNSSCCGIESVIDPNKLRDAALNPDVVESYVDYLFFNHTFQDKCEQLYNITELKPEFTHFRIDIEHLTLYNLTPSDTIEVKRSC